MIGENKYSSILLENAVNEFAQLPGIGRKTALRLVLHLLKQEDNRIFSFTESLNQLKQNICHCKECNTISDTEICPICANENRTGEILCVVENVRDVLSIENFKKLKPYEVRVTTLARGVALGDELEYADELTLGRSIKHRTPYEETFIT